MKLDPKIGDVLWHRAGVSPNVLIDVPYLVIEVMAEPIKNDCWDGGDTSVCFLSLENGNTVWLSGYAMRSLTKQSRLYVL